MQNWNKVGVAHSPIDLDLGCGPYKREDFIGLDREDFGQEIICDLTQGIPLPNNSVRYLYTSHCLEHFEREKLHYVLMEMFRVTMPGGKWEIRVPHADTVEAHSPCHYTFWSEITMKGIGIWFPKNGTTIELDSIQRDGIHLIGMFTVLKG